MMMNSCITCFALLLTSSLTHASGKFGGGRGGMLYLFHNFKHHIDSVNSEIWNLKLESKLTIAYPKYE